jgi:hypothetical protein
VILINKQITKLIGYGVLLSVFFSAVFGRSFVGLLIKNIQLGKLLIFGSFIISLIFLVYSFIDYKYFYNEILLSRIHQIIIISFFISILINNTTFLSSYTFKSSSYIWTLSFLFLGKLVSENNLLTKKIQMLFMLVLPLNYLFSTGRYPDLFISFFNNYSDKFQFLKGSDILLVYLITIIFSYQLFSSTKNKIIFLFITTAVMIPLLLFLSRGAFLPASIFFIIEVVFWRKEIAKNLSFTLLIIVLCIPIFLASTLNVYGNLSFTKIEDSIQTTEENIILDNFTSLIKDKNTHKVFFSFYILDGRLTSEDITSRWRLDIWQDVIEDMYEGNLFLSGYGYNDIIPAMTDPNEPGRTGRDGTNENLHNYFINILARGGFFQLILFLIFFSLIINSLRKENKIFRVANFLIAALIASSFDPSMEGVQFPFIFYFFVGYLMSQNLRLSKSYQ